MNVEIFDPVLCCATGVCGPQVDPVLVRIAGDLRWLQENGHTVRRHNLGQEPAAFAGNELVRAELQRSGEAALPLALVNGRVIARGRYPSRDEILAAAPASTTARVTITPLPPLPGSATASAASTGDCGCRGSCVPERP